MRTNQKKIWKLFCLISAILSVLLIAFGFWLYTGQLTQKKIYIFNWFPFPVASVNGQLVPMKEFTIRYNVAKKISGANQSAKKETEIKTTIFYELVNEIQTDQIARKFGILVSKKEINEEFVARVSATSLKGENSYEALLQSYGVSEALFKANILRPQLQLNNLKVWYNSNQNFNFQTYLQAKSLVDKIKTGDDMAVLAAKYSEDEVGKGALGDLGFVDVSEILPELRQTVASMNIGEVKIITSRFGLHIIRLEEKNGNLLHLRQIFLKINSFQNWFSSETKNSKINKFIQI